MILLELVMPVSFDDIKKFLGQLQPNAYVAMIDSINETFKGGWVHFMLFLEQNQEGRDQFMKDFNSAFNESSEELIARETKKAERKRKMYVPRK